MRLGSIWARCARRRFAGNGSRRPLAPPPGSLAASRVRHSPAARSPATRGFVILRAMDSRLVAHGEPAAYFTFPSLTAVGVPHATTTRHCPGVVSFAEPIAPEAPRAPFRPQAAAGLGSGRRELSRAGAARWSGRCCYEVDEPVTAEFARAFGERWTAWARPSRPGHVMLDLWTANETLLTEAGVAPASVDNPRLCTACHPELLYSYRKGNRGRLVTVAALP